VSTLKNHDTQALDALTGGVFSAPTSGERAARVREWLSSEPNAEHMQEVFRELSSRDKGAARLLREKLDEIKRAKGQEAISAEWAEKARHLLSQPRLNIADAMAWQRDAAKAGAPLSREPLAGVKTQLADRIRGIEDLQNRVQVQREAAVLLAQRIEVLSTKSWKDAEAAAEALRTDVPQWESQAQSLLDDPNWGSVDTRFPPLLDASRSQLRVVWEAFQSALAQATAASLDPSAPLPPVPVWADELRQGRGHAPESAPAKPAKAKVDPELRAKANQVISDALAKLEQEVGQGHGKASAGAANALRMALKEHGKLVDDKLEAHAHAALGAATELEGWQRWRADQLRQELVAKAEALFETVPVKGRPAITAPAAGTGPHSSPAPAPEAEASASLQVEGEATAAPAESEAQPIEAAAPPTVRKPRFGGRKMQETLRSLREQWKQVDQGGPPNHALWKRFDEACNEAYKVVQEWLDKVKAEAAEHRSARLALIEEVKAWASAHPEAAQGDWKSFNRALHQFSDRWRDAGHLSEKAFAELQPQWKDAIGLAAAPLERAQKASIDRRNAMIEEAKVLGEAPMLRIDAVKSLQQRWQAEAQTVPLDRKQEQRLWDAFRKPIDDAFNRKTAEREKAAAAMSGRDRAVLEASKAVEEATASGDAQKIRAAMLALKQGRRLLPRTVADLNPRAALWRPSRESKKLPPPRRNLRLSQWWRCAAVTTGPVRGEPTWRQRRVAAGSMPGAPDRAAAMRETTSEAAVSAASAMIAARTADLAWVMRRSARSEKRWSTRRPLCASLRRRRTAKHFRS
jgi:ATP-dependent RNA helicase SUPV3L1/SUV3